MKLLLGIHSLEKLDMGNNIYNKNFLQMIYGLNQLQKKWWSQPQKV